MHKCHFQQKKSSSLYCFYIVHCLSTPTWTHCASHFQCLLGYLSVSIIQWTLTSTIGSLTYICDFSACVCTHWGHIIHIIYIFFFKLNISTVTRHTPRKEKRKEKKTQTNTSIHDDNKKWSVNLFPRRRCFHWNLQTKHRHWQQTPNTARTWVCRISAMQPHNRFPVV